MIYQQDPTLNLIISDSPNVIVGWDEERIIRYIQIPGEHVDDDGVLYQFNALFIHGHLKKIVEPTS